MGRRVRYRGGQQWSAGKWIVGLLQFLLQMLQAIHV
jgi:hypothetical protein